MDEIGKVHVHTPAGDYAGYVRVDKDEVGNLVGEVYNPAADRIGAIRYEPLEYEPEESLIHDESGARVGFVRLVRNADGDLEATVYVLREAGTSAEAYAYLHEDEMEEGIFVLRKEDPEGEQLGRLQPENVSTEPALLIGGGGGLLLLA